MEAARQRVATANAWRKSAEEQKKSAEDQKKLIEKQLESAIDRAKKQLKSATHSVKEAESFLKEACERWEVIEVDDDEEDDVTDDVVNGDTRKRASVSPDPGIDPNGTHSNNAAAVASQVQQISVEGAGSSDVNGTYKLCQSSDGKLLLKRDKSFPVFSKSGTWEGKAVDFYIYRSGYGSWWIACRQDSGQSAAHLYRADGSTDLLPPKTRWRYGINVINSIRSRQAPELKW
eukprot:CAMPEP_0181090878 /NCGR_PEP_ID=MMETSP1071-20121207/8099_1 /TAXON_ID=35127 /ORGANISM="Thalassiosira sp., Strain NH16" /LENGTH=231 /DNA_ID=CAMNT_0023172979 /DNA_START=15 /DNA_END=710 /DNA_ORIENTATION=+